MFLIFIHFVKINGDTWAAMFLKKIVFVFLNKNKIMLNQKLKMRVLKKKVRTRPDQ